MSQGSSIQEQLLDLAQHASTYLRRHNSKAVRIAVALLLATSLAACNASTTDTTVVQTQNVAPLTQEVASGLPAAPGLYPVVPGTVYRDQRGVYRLEWRNPGESGGSGQVAFVSRLRMLQDSQLALEIVANGDPVLHLPNDANIGIIEQTQVVTTQVNTPYQGHVYGYWNPFITGYLIGSSRPAYYEPPRTIVVTQAPGEVTSGGSSSSGSTSAPLRIGGGSVSESPKPPAQRVTGIQSAVSGRAGGTGAGNAVTSRNLNSGASSSSAARTSGTSGSTGSTGSTTGSAGAVTSRSGSSGSTGTTGSSAASSANSVSKSSSSGVSAPRSSGFSSGGSSARSSSAS